MQPRIARPTASAMTPTGSIADPSVKTAIDELQRRQRESEAKLAALERQGQTGGSTVSAEALSSLRVENGRLRAYKRRTLYREQGLPSVSEEIPAGTLEVGTGSGGGGTTINQNVTNNYTTKNYQGGIRIIGGAEE